MIAIDTNVVVRFLVGDDLSQAGVARTLFAENRITIPHTVLLETEWVLRRSYAFARDRIAKAFLDLLGIESVSCADGDAVRRAVEALARGCDFGDAMHVTTAEPGATEFVTFDNALAQAARTMEAPLPVRLLKRRTTR